MFFRCVSASRCHLSPYFIWARSSSRNLAVISWSRIFNKMKCWLKIMFGILIIIQTYHCYLNSTCSRMFTQLPTSIQLSNKLWLSDSTNYMRLNDTDTLGPCCHLTIGRMWSTMTPSKMSRTVLLVWASMSFRNQYSTRPVALQAIPSLAEFYIPILSLCWPEEESRIAHAQVIVSTNLLHNKHTAPVCGDRRS